MLYRRWNIVSVVLLLCVGALPAAGSLAFGPILLTDYEFAPKQSTLHVTGGFAGIDETLRIEGGFSLATGLDQVFEPNGDFIQISLVPFASFTHVKANASNRSGWNFDLDQSLNLTGLDGSFEFGQPNRFTFTGQDGQGQDIRLQANRKGDWLHLTGSSRPGCCDMFQYEIDAWAHVASRGNGRESSVGYPGGGQRSASIPEPTSLALLLVGGLALARRRRTA